MELSPLLCLFIMDHLGEGELEYTDQKFPFPLQIIPGTYRLVSMKTNFRIIVQYSIKFCNGFFGKMFQNILGNWIGYKLILVIKELL